jgi:glycosyltransferase XagB
MMRALLTVTGGPQCDRQWTIEPDSPLTIGRGSDADLVLLDGEASRLHCRLSCVDDQWRVDDNSSLNGIFVNGDKVDGAELKHGDNIRIGGTTIRFHILHNGAATEVAEPPDFAGPELLEPTVKMAEPQAARPAPATVAAAPPPPVVDQPAPHRTGQYQPPSIVRVEKEETIDAFIDKHPNDTSNIVVSTAQKLWYAFVVFVLLAALVYDPLYFLHIVHVLCLFYLVVIAYKLIVVFLSVVRRWEIRPKPAEVAGLLDADLPVYTILVPLYKEKEVVHKIVPHLAALDYPKDKLDVKILLEPDDPETLDAIRDSGLPDYCEVIICPDSQPRTKPKACNHGLARARGDLAVIYDAEDRPEPDQLKKAVVAFRQAQRTWEKRRWLRAINPFQRANRGRTVCLQAKLSYYNPKQNILTRWFTIEYATWFQLYLPGLHALRAPIPLGGTSNHFRTEVLREIGGWDPFNVTEDCDLGIRLHKRGYATQVVDSITWEEANSRVGNWIRQRSRWVKGYLQTHLTHMRHPLRTLWQLRPWGMFNFLNSVGGLSLMLLLNPIFWAASVLFVGLFAMDLHENGYSIERTLGVNESFEEAGDDIVKDRTVRIPYRGRRAWTFICGARPEAVPEGLDWKGKLWLVIRESWQKSWDDIWSSHRQFHFWNIASQIFFLCTIVLILGNIFFVLMHVAACIRARMPSMIPLALLMPFYWILISIAAYKGFLQLFFKPFYWEKTQHGLDSDAA